jgi:hypothetical protein
VHLGFRAQASLVLSCPGIELSVLRRDARDGRRAPEEPFGLQSELTALEALIGSPGTKETILAAQDEHTAVLRRAHRRPGWVEGDGWRERLILSPPAPFDPGTVDLGDPIESDGLDTLPLFKDENHGIVGVAAAEDGWELLQLDPEGGVRDRLGTYPGPDPGTRTTADGSDLLRGYLSYLAARDATVDTVLLEWLGGRSSSESFPDAVRIELQRAGLIVLTRAVLRAQLDGRPGAQLDAADIARGIRATDAELLDRPSVGIPL